MRVGVITFWWSGDNYGQLLQAYALQQELLRLGHDPYLIKYDRRKDIPRSPVIRLRTGLDVLFSGKFLKALRERRNPSAAQVEDDRGFDKFLAGRLTVSPVYGSYGELVRNPPRADAYIVGSDQVWYFPREYLYKLQNWVNAYFLNFGDEATRRISYAASFSATSFPRSFYKKAAKLLARFSTVTVREQSGIEVCRRCRADARLVVDPTLLLGRGDWNAIAPAQTQKRDLTLYFLGSHCSIPFGRIYEFADMSGWNVQYIASQGRVDEYEKVAPTIEEFLGMIRDSEYFITNSFHGAIFAIVFNVPFVAIPLEKKFSSMNERIHSLLALMGLEDRLARPEGDIMEQLQQPIDWDKVNGNLETNKKISEDILKEALS